MTNLTCPHCKNLHGVYWLVKPGGSRALTYTCNKFPVIKLLGILPSGEREKKYTHKTTELAVTDTDHANHPGLGKGAPERWSKKFAEKQQKQKQGQLMMMIERKEP